MKKTTRKTTRKIRYGRLAIVIIAFIVFVISAIMFVRTFAINAKAYAITYSYGLECDYITNNYMPDSKAMYDALDEQYEIVKAERQALYASSDYANWLCNLNSFLQFSIMIFFALPIVLVVYFVRMIVKTESKKQKIIAA